MALAAIQGLKQEKDREIERVATRNATLKSQLPAQDERIVPLEMALSELLDRQGYELQVGSAR